MERDSKGFAWLELIVGLVIVVLIAKILVPSIISKQSEIDETSALLSIHNIMQAEDNYATAYDHGYSESLATLGPPAQAMPNSTVAGYLDDELAAGKKQGYSFTYKPGQPDENGRIQSYTLTVNPVKPGDSGTKYYFVGPILGDEKTEIIRVSSSHPATAEDKPLGG
jgi:type II secretory pathway pseudopilin PulG